MMAVLGKPEGRRVLNRILAHCGMMQMSYQPGADIGQVAFKEGMRNVGNWLASEMVRVDPAAHTAMIKEMFDE